MPPVLDLRSWNHGTGAGVAHGSTTYKQLKYRRSLIFAISLFRIFICIFIGWAFELHLMDHSDVAAIQTNHPHLRVLAGGLKGFPL
jgi:hypothetical protein